MEKKDLEEWIDRKQKEYIEKYGRLPTDKELYRK